MSDDTPPGGLATVEINLPFPPSVNHYYRHVGTRTLISREGRRFRTRVCVSLASRPMQKLYGPLHIEIDVYPPDHRRRDIDNVQKALLDALQHAGLYEDDSQITILQIAKCKCIPGGRTTVRIRVIEQ